MLRSNLRRVVVFALPRPFRGPFDVIQRNAIESWVRLGADCQVVLFGDEEGTAAVANELGVRHVPEVERNEFGTPLLGGVFETARALADKEALCYVNSDIVLLDDFLPALQRTRARKSQFLMVGQCWNLELDGPLDFEDPRWRSRLRQLTATGRQRGKSAIDYFAFSRDLYDHVPAFAIGRMYFDNWLIWKARALGAAVVDATRAVDAVHQHHDYSHVAGGKDWAYFGPEVDENIRLGGGLEHADTIREATHVLTQRRLRKPVSPLTFEYHWERWLRAVVWAIYGVTRPVRHRLGIRAGMFRKRVTRLR
jgi:hypothetical protein